MFYPQRIPDNRLAREALAHARTPAAWLVALQNAVVSVDVLRVADDALTSFRRDASLAGENPLAALGSAPDENWTEAAAASESVPQRARRDLVWSASRGGAMAQATAEPMPSRRTTSPVAPRTGPAQAAEATPGSGRVGGQRGNVASPVEQPLPPSAPLTLPVLELQQMARVTQSKAQEASRPGRKTRQPTAPSGAAGGPERSDAARLASSPDLRDRVRGQARSTERWPWMPRWERTPAEPRLPVVPPGPSTTSGPVSHSLPDTAADGLAQTTKSADVMARAGATVVGRGTHPSHLLAELVANQPDARAVGPFRSVDQAQGANTAGRPDLPPLLSGAGGRAAVPAGESGPAPQRGRPGVGTHATGKESFSTATASGANPAAEPRPTEPSGASLLDGMLTRREAATGPLLSPTDSSNARWLPTVPMSASPAGSMAASSPAGAALLSETLAHFSAPAEPLVPASADRLALATGEGAASTGASTPTASVESPALPAAPAIQNTFNVTVHMAGTTLANEEELAERLTRVLIEQARRNGIDI